MNGSSTFHGSVDFVDGGVTFHQNAEVLVLSPTRFDDDVLFEDSVTFTDDVNFLGKYPSSPYRNGGTTS